MQVSDTKACCRCGRDVTETVRYAARKPLPPLPPGAKTGATLYDCQRCAVQLLLAELKESKEREKHLESELKEEKAVHQETRADLTRKELEFDNAQVHCTALQNAFKKYSYSKPADEKLKFNALVKEQLDIIQSAFAAQKARWLEQQARELEQKAAKDSQEALDLSKKAAKDSQEALDLRKQAQQLRGQSNFQKLSNQHAARHPGPAAGGSLPKKPKTGGV